MTRRRPTTDELVIELRAMQPDAGFSGIVVKGGAGSSGPTVGDEVFGPPSAARGSGGFVVCRRSELALKPSALAPAEAVVLARAGTLALRAVRSLVARPRERVLITGAGGDVGAIAVQIAKVRGAHVTGMCADRDVPRVWDLGADDVYACDRQAGMRGRFAAVIDTDGSVAPEVAARLLERDGRLVALREGAIHVSNACGTPITVHPHAPPSAAELAELARLVERHGVFPVERRPP